jgi:hypothetical protein
MYKSLNNMIIIEKIYVDNECSVIMLNSSAAPHGAFFEGE